MEFNTILLCLFFTTGAFRMFYEHVPQMQSDRYKENLKLQDDDSDDDVYYL